MPKKSHHAPPAHKSHQEHHNPHQHENNHSHHEHTSTEHSEHSPSSANEHLQKKINENLVQLQKVHINLAEKFSHLSAQVEALLGLFEVAAKSFVDNPANQVAEKDKEFLEKIENVLEQNKTLARGLTLVEEKMREHQTPHYSPTPTYSPSPPLYPPASVQQKPKENNNDEEATYEPSINKPLPKF